jgi:polysaccharide biosynthesis/export protein
VIIRESIQNLLRVGFCACLLMTAATAWGMVSTIHSGIAQGLEVKWAAQGGDKTTPAPAAPSPRNAHVGEDYIIGPSDVLDINVWKNPQLSARVPVRPDGRITLPLIGEIQVSGLTAMNVQLIVSRKLKEYIANPDVTVMVAEIKSPTYVVVGKIIRPGAYELTKPTTVLEAIAIAGGLQDFAKSGKIYILSHTETGTQIRLPFNYKKVIDQRAPGENVYLKAGDTIVVP